MALYSSDGVEASCLVLQDEGGTDVCELLWLCWLNRHGLTTTEDIEGHLAAVRQWQADMTHPLRHRRRTLKEATKNQASRAELRQALKHAELLAEREALLLLQDLAEHGGGTRLLHQEDPPLSRRLAQWLPHPKECLSRSLEEALMTLSMTSTVLTLPPSRASLN
ncbi:TIGR02444 family protein [Aidingimonas halophila]|uniref:TIGR02444 family protein n=1 Tax=Aidingimonas halophila TaxID=574349 RepID=A0A1H2Y405_9GAMM|nr:TIGR02444 family protein [Aidingimonas halophila]